MSKKLQFLGLCAVLSLAAFFVAQKLASSQSPPRYRALRSQTYTLRKTERTTHVANGTTLEKQVLFAVRGDLSTAEVVLPGGAVPPDATIRVLYVHPERKEVHISDPTGTKATVYFARNITPLPATRSTRPTCGPNPAPGRTIAYLGESEFLGFRVFRHRWEEFIDPANRGAHTEAWFAADLDCEVLMIRTEYRDRQGKLLDVFERIVTSAERGEPDTRIFDVPSSYREVTPSEQRQAIWAIAYPGKPDRMSGAMQRIDQRYREGQKLKLQ